MRQRPRTRRLVALAAFVVGVVAVPSAWAWTVTMDAQPALKRTHSWKIEKSVSQSSVTLKQGETATVSYSVTVGPAGAPVDSDWSVSGTMEMTDDPNITVNSVVFKVIPEAPVNTPEILASHSCMPMTFPVDLGIAGLECVYSAALPNADARRAWMRATAVEDDGTTGRQERAAAIHLRLCSRERGRRVRQRDRLDGGRPRHRLRRRRAEDVHLLDDDRPVRDECGSNTVNNTASFLTNDTGATGSSSASVNVTVVCEPPPPGCTHTIGYWKTHAGFGPQADVVTALLPIGLGTAGGAKSLVVTTAAQAVSLLNRAGSNGVVASSNGINKLYAQLLGAKLSGADGADTGPAAAAIAAADAFLANNNSLSWSTLSKAQQGTVNGWMTTLDQYNNGLLGVAHCG